MENNRLRFKIRAAYQKDDIALAERLEAELMEIDPTYVPVIAYKPFEFTGSTPESYIGKRHRI